MHCTYTNLDGTAHGTVRLFGAAYAPRLQAVQHVTVQNKRLNQAGQSHGVERGSKHAMCEAVAGVTRHTVLQKMV